MQNVTANQIAVISTPAAAGVPESYSLGFGKTFPASAFKPAAGGLPVVLSGLAAYTSNAGDRGLSVVATSADGFSQTFIALAKGFVGGEGSPAAGDKVSPQANSWYVKEGSLFPVAGADDIAAGVYRIFITGGGGGGQQVMFTIDEVYSTAVAASDHCDDKLRDAKDRYMASCVKVSCGSGAPVTDENGQFEVIDYLGFLTGREEADVIGKTGMATYMSDCDGYEQCEWVITWIDWFRERTVMTGFTITDTNLCFDFENVKVWDHCLLDPQCIPLTDCEEY